TTGRTEGARSDRPEPRAGNRPGYPGGRTHRMSRRRFNEGRFHSAGEEPFMQHRQRPWRLWAGVLVMLLLDPAVQAKAKPARVPVLPDREAWKHLPPADRGTGQPLPVWARALAASLPRTTAAMLELDYLHRARSPLDPKLRGKLRWVAAHANRCAYTQAYAAADLRRAGVEDKTIRALAGDFAGLPAPEKAALAFARN